MILNAILEGYGVTLKENEESYGAGFGTGSGLGDGKGRGNGTGIGNGRGIGNGTLYGESPTVYHLTLKGSHP